MELPTCPYCGKAAELVNGRIVYPHRPDLYRKNFWRCAPCDAYVGCHRGSAKPLGRLANPELRLAKMQAHAAFDPIWSRGHMTRNEAYVWLADKLGVIQEACHIGMFDVRTCQRVIQLCEKYQHEQESD